MKDYPRLPESELDIMLVVWELKEATAPAILERLERPLTASALHSYLKRLEEKGYLACRKEGKRTATPRWWSGRPIAARRDAPSWESCTRGPSSALPPPSTTAER